MPEISTAGVIGLGNAGWKHVTTYGSEGLQTRYYDPRHTADVTPASGNYIARRAELEEVLACDVVSICSPDDTHFEYINKI